LAVGARSKQGSETSS
jgi:hypothetical protein